MRSHTCADTDWLCVSPAAFSHLWNPTATSQQSAFLLVSYRAIRLWTLGVLCCTRFIFSAPLQARSFLIFFFENSASCWLIVVFSSFYSDIFFNFAESGKKIFFFFFVFNQRFKKKKPHTHTKHHIPMRRDLCFHNVPSAVEDDLSLIGSEIRSGHGVTHRSQTDSSRNSYFWIRPAWNFAAFFFWYRIPEYCNVILKTSLLRSCGGPVWILRSTSASRTHHTHLTHTHLLRDSVTSLIDVRSQ